MSDKIRISGMIDDSIVDGAGLRLCLFVQGCPFRCVGCHNPKTHSYDGGYLITLSEIVKKIEDNPLLDGVTISGGEPFIQAENLLSLAKIVKEKKLHLAIYTGFLFENLIKENAPKGAKTLLEFTDILIDGPFVLSQKDDLKFKGSANQRIINVPQSLKNNKVVLDTSEDWN